MKGLLDMLDRADKTLAGIEIHDGGALTAAERRMRRRWRIQVLDARAVIQETRRRIEREDQVTPTTLDQRQEDTMTVEQSHTVKLTLSTEDKASLRKFLTDNVPAFVALSDADKDSIVNRVAGWANTAIPPTAG